MTPPSMHDVIRQHVLDHYLRGQRPEGLTDSTPLVTSGMLDSLAVVELVLFLEKHFNVQFEAHEVDLNQLDTINDIVRTLSEKLR